MYKKRRVAKRKGAKRSYAMVPRPRLNNELAHRHIVTVGSATGTGAIPIRLQQIGGQLQFFGGIGFSPNMSISWSLANMVIALGGTVITTNPMPNIAELQNLYDTFQLEKVEVTIFFGTTESIASNDVNLGARYVMPVIGFSQDTDDASNTSITQLQQYSTYRTHQSTSPLKISLVPCPAGTVFDPAQGGAGFNAGFTRLQRQDINVAYAATPHYGLKLCVDGMQNNAADAVVSTFLSISTRCHFIMKNTR